MLGYRHDIIVCRFPYYLVRLLHSTTASSTHYLKASTIPRCRLLRWHFCHCLVKVHTLNQGGSIEHTCQVPCPDLALTPLEQLGLWCFAQEHFRRDLSTESTVEQDQFYNRQAPAAL